MSLAVAGVPSICSRVRPYDVAALIQLGLSEKASGRSGEPAAGSRTRAELDPGSAVAAASTWARRSTTSGAQRRRARRRCEPPIRHNPDYADAHFLLSFVLGDMGQHERGAGGDEARDRAQPVAAHARRRTSRSTSYDPKGK